MQVCVRCRAQEMVGGSGRVRAGWVVAAGGTPVRASADGGIDDYRNAHRDIFKNKDERRRERSGNMRRLELSPRRKDIQIENEQTAWL